MGFIRHGGDFNDDFEGFDNEESCDEADFEDDANDDLDDDFGDSSIENDVECDDFSGKDAFFIGSAMGWAYDEGLWKGVLQRQKKKAKKKL